MIDKLKAFEGSDIEEICTSFRKWYAELPRKRIFDTSIGICRDSRGSRELSGYWYVLLVRWGEIKKDRRDPQALRGYPERRRFFGHGGIRREG